MIPPERCHNFVVVHQLLHHVAHLAVLAHAVDANGGGVGAESHEGQVAVAGVKMQERCVTCDTCCRVCITCSMRGKLLGRGARSRGRGIGRTCEVKGGVGGRGVGQGRSGRGAEKGQGFRGGRGGGIKLRRRRRRRRRRRPKCFRGFALPHDTFPFPFRNTKSVNYNRFVVVMQQQHKGVTACTVLQALVLPSFPHQTQQPNCTKKMNKPERPLKNSDPHTHTHTRTVTHTHNLGPPLLHPCGHATHL